MLDPLVYLQEVKEGKMQIIGIIYLSLVVLAAEGLLWKRLYWTYKLYT